jgi:hypothetical protein
MSEGVTFLKTIETRSWSTKYRGPLAIHAALREPKEEQIGDWYVTRRPTVTVGPKDESLTLPGRWIVGAMVDDRNEAHALPPGAIVGTCTLVDVVPMTTHADIGDPECVVVHGDGTADHCIPSSPPPPDSPQIVRLDAVDIPDGAHLIRDITDQVPYDDFTPGRYAWLLADAVALPEPVPFKGGQGLTKTWVPPVAA